MAESQRKRATCGGLLIPFWCSFSVLSMLLISYKMVSGMALGGVVDFSWIYVNLRYRLYSGAVLSLIYFVLSCYGFVLWLH